MGVRAALRGQAVSIRYRGNELIVTDKQNDANKVWSALQSISTKYNFAVALSSKEFNFTSKGKPLLLWIHREPEVNLIPNFSPSSENGVGVVPNPSPSGEKEVGVELSNSISSEERGAQRTWIIREAV
jgi:hypothetical protein